MCFSHQRIIARLFSNQKLSRNIFLILEIYVYHKDKKA